MPAKPLPLNPSIIQLKNQAKDLMRARENGDRAALQRIREFHPRFSRYGDAEIAAAKFVLSDAQFTIAREYGFANWPRLKARLEAPNKAADQQLPTIERIQDLIFRRAVDLLDAGDEKGLRAHLQAHPEVVHQRLEFDGGNYFRSPALLEFAAENPVRHGRLPSNIVEVARVILDLGGRTDRKAINSTLGLVCSGRVARECDVQVPLIDLLCDYGSDLDAAMLPALAHGEFSAVEALLRRGASLCLPVAAATGKLDDARRLLTAASSEERHIALALACQHGQLDVVRLLLDAGEDPDRYNPVGCHSHSTPLHQAALAGHLEVVRLLVERGSRLDTRDILFDGTPAGWAEHGGKTEIAAYLRSREAGTSSKGS
jgi:Ankyrin repeats (3 copies)